MVFLGTAEVDRLTIPDSEDLEDLEGLDDLEGTVFPGVFPDVFLTEDLETAI